MSLSQSVRQTGFSLSMAADRRGPGKGTGTMDILQERDFNRVPGLYRLWDLQFVIDNGQDWQVRYAALTEDGTPLFSVFRRDGAMSGRAVQ